MNQNTLAIIVLVITLLAIAKATYPSLRKLYTAYLIQSYERKLEGINFRLTWFNPEYNGLGKMDLFYQKQILEEELQKLKNIKF
jgi:hypothetical protein